MTAGDIGNLCQEAQALRLQGKREEAMALLEEALRIDPDSIEAGTLLARVLRDQGRRADAVALLERLTQAHPTDPAPWRLLGFVHWRAGKPADGLAPLQRHAALLPNDASAQLDLAKLHLELGDWASALSCIRRVGAADPAAATARFMEGLALFESGDSESAMRTYAELIKGRRAPGEPETGRLREAWITDLPSWAEAGGGECRVVVPPQPMDIPRSRVIPASERKLWTSGQAQAPEAFVGKLHDAEVTGGEFVVISADDCLFLQGFVSSPRLFPQKKGGPVKYLSRDNRVLLDLPRHPIEQEGPCLLLGRPTNHFHFLLESLPRILSLERYGVGDDVPALVPDDLYPTSLEILAMLGFPAERLIQVPAKGSVRCGTLYAPSLLGFGVLPSPVALGFVRERLLPKAAVAAEMPKRVYLSRNRMPRRHVQNEAELLPLLERHGFRTVYPEQLGVSEQIGMFAQAEAIVSPDSSALANLVFAAPSAKVGVFSARGLHVPLWHWIAHVAGAELTYIHVDAVVDSHARHHHRDMNVDPALVAQWLESL